MTLLCYLVASDYCFLLVFRWYRTAGASMPAIEPPILKR